MDNHPTTELQINGYADKVGKKNGVTVNFQL